MLCYINEKEGQINVEKGRRLMRGEERLREGKEKIKGSREKRVRGISKVFKLFGRILGRYKALKGKTFQVMELCNCPFSLVFTTCSKISFFQPLSRS